MMRAAERRRHRGHEPRHTFCDVIGLSLENVVRRRHDRLCRHSGEVVAMKLGRHGRRLAGRRLRRGLPLDGAALARALRTLFLTLALAARRAGALDHGTSRRLDGRRGCPRTRCAREPDHYGLAIGANERRYVSAIAPAVIRAKGA